MSVADRLSGVLVVCFACHAPGPALSNEAADGDVQPLAGREGRMILVRDVRSHPSLRVGDEVEVDESTPATPWIARQVLVRGLGGADRPRAPLVPSTKRSPM